MANAQSDVGARKLAEQRVEASRVLESLQGALASDAALLSEAESTAIAAAVEALQQATQGSDPAAIEAAIKNIRCTNARLCRAPHGCFHSPCAGWPFCG
jgi:molecular chaperone HscA